MSTRISVRKKIKNVFRIDRAFRFVWRASPGWTVLNTFLAILQGLLPLLSLYLIKLIVDTITSAVQSDYSEVVFREIVFLVALATGAALVQAAFSRLTAYATEAQSVTVTDYVYDVMHKKSVSLDLAYYENPQYFDTLHRAQQEGPYRPTRIVSGLNQVGQSFVVLAGMVGLLFTFHWSAAILLFVSTLPGLWVQLLFARKNYCWQKEVTPLERRASYYSEILTGDMFAKEIRLFGLGSFFSTGFNLLRRKIRKERLSLARHRSIADFFSQGFALFILMGCFLYIGDQTLKGVITIGAMVMYFQAFQRGLTSLKNLLQYLAWLYEDNLFVAHFFTFLDIDNSIVDTKNPVSLPRGNRASITFNNVSFKYPGVREDVLKGVSFEIHPGEVIALVGANGAGKSTIVKLLCRLYDPKDGEIYFDQINYKQLSAKDLRKRISAVFQDFVQYSLSVRNNIKLGDIDSDRSSKELESAAAKAGIEDVILKLPNGYETILGKQFAKGEELSYGEWQRLVVARAFYKDASLVILDEPSSSLDIDSEFELFQNFKHLISGKSALIISHRFSTVKIADRVLVLEKGKIVETGSHNELMRIRGRYFEMYTKQTKWFE